MTAFTLRTAFCAGVFLLSLVMRAASTNGLVRRKLRMSIFLGAACIAVSAVLGGFAFSPGVSERMLSVLHLSLALAIINLLVITIINPLRVDRVPERFPNILQDTVIIGLFFVVATVVMREKFLTTSAVGAVVVGFALQDTLGNMFSGLAIQVEKPFRIGQWILLGRLEGQVSEVTWRATKLRTRAGNLVILPNAFVSKEAIVNYSQPETTTRLQTDVGVSYSVPPNQVKQALLEAVGNVSLALSHPPPNVLMVDFGESAIVYRVLYWINDFSQDMIAQDQMRSAIYYSLQRHGYEIPLPMRVQIPRMDQAEPASERTARISRILGQVPIFASLSAEERDGLAARSVERIYGQGERIVRQGEAGGSMFVVSRGSVRVIEASGGEVAVIKTGGYLGEMSMLTGQPRSATVEAIEECAAVELTSESLREVAMVNPELLTRISDVVVERRADLDRQKAQATAAQATASGTPRSLLERIQDFLRLPKLGR